MKQSTPGEMFKYENIGVTIFLNLNIIIFGL
jgi:hypothetical protein